MGEGERWVGRKGREEAGWTAQEGMEEQIDPATLVTDGTYDVDHLDFTRSAGAPPLHR